MPARRKIPSLVAILCATAALAGCETLGYYWQAGAGHLALMRQRVEVDGLLASAQTEPDVRRALERAVSIRDYAGGVLQLPVEGSYRHWVAVAGDAVSWNVFAAEPLALKAVQWCFPVAGCVAYRGYFERARAQAYADQLAAKGYDVYVGGVSAYSTLGWFDDPLLSTFVRYDDVRLAGLLFHELAHRVAYVKGDTTFNESFATAVEVLGVEQWLRDGGRDDERARYAQWRQDYDAFIAWLLLERQALDRLYRSGLDEARMRAAKQAFFEALWAQSYPSFRAARGGAAYFDRWAEGVWNNARLLSIASYHDRVDAFRHQFQQLGCDWPAFYDAARSLAGLPADDRGAALDRLQAARPEAC